MRFKFSFGFVALYIYIPHILFIFSLKTVLKEEFLDNLGFIHLGICLVIFAGWLDLIFIYLNLDKFHIRGNTAHVKVHFYIQKVNEIFFLYISTYISKLMLLKRLKKRFSNVRHYFLYYLVLSSGRHPSIDRASPYEQPYFGIKYVGILITKSNHVLHQIRFCFLIQVASL